MKHNRDLAIIAAIIFAVAGSALAQQADSAQRQTRQPAVQSDRNAPMMACACGHMEPGVAACSGVVATETAKHNHTANAKDKRTPTWQEVDPSAPQNRVEYGGAG